MAGTDLLTDAELADALAGIAPIADALAAIYLSAVSARLDDLCGPIVARAVVEVHDAGRYIVLDHKPMGAVTSITVRSGTTLTTVDLTQTVVDPAGVVEWPCHVFGDGPRSVTVAYTAGRCVSTETVPAIFKLAATRMLQGLWRPAESAGPEGFAPPPPTLVPDEVLLILGSEVRGPAIA